MKFDVESFRQWDRKCITLMGMSGVGKTYLSNILRKSHWFHYSGDYRIGTRYLDEHIMDLIKQEAMKVPFLKDLLRNDWVSIQNKIKIDDLGPVSKFLGKLGNPALGGVELGAFQHRQQLHHEAELKAMLDVPEFIRKADEIYGYQHFINDAGGSLCELGDQRVIDCLADNTLILYIKTTNEEEEQQLIDRALSNPKPLFYRRAFLEQQLSEYLEESNLEYAAQMVPDDFTRWVFPRLFKSRLPRYAAIAEPYGYTVTSKEAAQVQSESDFLDLLEMAIERQAKED